MYAESRPYVALRVFDWDLVSADDFLGQVCSCCSRPQNLGQLCKAGLPC